MEDVQVKIKHVQIAEAPDAPGYVRTGRFTDILVTAGGRHFYSRESGWLSSGEGYAKAQFAKRQKRGFYVER